MPHEALWQLIQKYGGDPDVPDLHSLRERFEYRDFPHFIEVWTWKNGFLREYEDFTFLAETVAHDLCRQNIRYVEAFYSPTDFARHGLEIQSITEALRTGLDRVPGVRVSLVADLVRDHGPARGRTTLSELIEVGDLGLLGIGIGGSEGAFPPEPFREVFEAARRAGFRTSAHAGETAGAESIWGAIRELEVDRIGHATRAEDDEKLLDHLAEARIPLEICPISNVRTGVVPRLEDHPVRRYFDRGLIVTINTDDPKMFGNTLSDELRQLADIHEFSRDEIRALLLGAVNSSWLSQPEKDALGKDLQGDPGWA
jgi:adenosine deaminase